MVGSGVLLLTGLLLAIFYRWLPAKLSREGGEIPFEEAGVARENFEASLAGTIATMPPELQNEVKEVVRASSSLEDLSRRCEGILARVATRQPDQIELVRDTLVLAGTRDYLLWTTAAARRIDFQLRIWRWVHVPVSVFVFFAIALHVWLVLWY
jgi:hypothetical protein